MPTIALHSLDSAPVASHPALQQVIRVSGRLPNMFAALANSPTALNAYLQLASALGQGAFDVAERERIALAVSAVNGCDYCLAAHGWLAQRLGLSASERAQAQAGAMPDALARLAAEITRNRGRVSEQGLAEARAAGYDDGQLVELVAQVALMTLSNYLNNLAQPAIDFPPA